MCGFVGYLGKEIDNKLFENMINTLNHRGPNSDGYWHDSDHKVHLAHKRLSILDLSSKGSQPMISSSGRYVIIYNGEIYNHLILRKKINHKSQNQIIWRGSSDTETL